MRKFLLFILIIVLVTSTLAVASCDTKAGGKLPRNVNFYAINDFHGATEKMAYVADYFKRADDGNSVFISSGDMFQGSIESNANYGNLLNDCMEESGFDAMTIGNHEFDWGLEKLRTLSQNSKVKFLGANIYNWNQSTKTFGDFADDIADEYIVKTLKNGLKVGVIGVIGYKQITSISSTLAQDIGFKNPMLVIPALSDKLRKVEKCDVVAISIHEGAKDSINYYDNLEEYADVVFCAHSHQEENLNSQGQNYKQGDGVPFIQGGAEGERISKVKLQVSGKGAVSCLNSENITVGKMWTKDSVVEQMVSQSNAQIADIAKEQLATLNGYLSSSINGVPRLACKAIADYAQNHDVAIDLAVTNNARNTLNGVITYSSLYEALPFDNVVYVAKVSGYDLMMQVGKSNYYGGYYNAMWRVREEAFSIDGEYTIAIIDYLLFHQDINRDYDYFPSAFENGKQPTPLCDLNYREITRDYLRTVESVDYREFYENSNFTDNGRLFDTVTLAQQSAQLAVASAFGGTQFVAF